MLEDKIGKTVQRILDNKLEQTKYEGETLKAEYEHTQMILPAMKETYQEMSYFREFKEKAYLGLMIYRKKRILKNVPKRLEELTEQYKNIKKKKRIFDNFMNETFRQVGIKMPEGNDNVVRFRRFNLEDLN